MKQLRSLRQPQAPRRTKYFFGLLTVLVVLQLFSPTRAMTQGDLLLMPRRVVFEGSKRYEELNLANTGRDTARYVISLMHIRMKEDGGFEQIMQPDSGENFADNYIRFFPHSVTLGPDESQVIKIQLTRINELTAGEYRSHLYFRAVPNQKPLGEKQAIPDSAISIRLIAVFGISIPVIIRTGESTTKVSLSDMKIEQGPGEIQALNIVFNRTGNMSVYGDLAIDFISAQGKTTRVGELKGIAVYAANSSRKVRVLLDKKPGINYKTGKLHIVYSTPPEAKYVRMAETELELL